MSYTPTTWQTGDTITAAGLNNMESGIVNATPLVIPVIIDTVNSPYIDAAIAGDIISQIPSHSRFVFEFFALNQKIFTAEAEYYATPLSFASNDYVLVVSLPETMLASFGWFGDDRSLMFAPATWNTGTPWVGIWFDFYGTAPFVVTLTPTAQDYSGTMDKTPVEIDEAYRAGRRIRFRVMGMDAEVDATQYVDNTTEPEYYQAAANVIYNGMLVQIITSRLDQTYRTVIYPLTPMS